MTEPAKKKTDRYVPTLDQVSAGGVAFRQIGSEIEIAIVLMVPEMRWQLPKGIIDEGETIEEAATREVREEAGIATEIITPIETIEYWFYADRDGKRIRYHKNVHFFLMRYVSGDVTDHDHEVAEARWVSVDDALQMLAFKSEKGIVTMAAKLIGELH